MGDNHKNAEMGWGHLKILSRTIEPDEQITRKLFVIM
jgi:hypothetical protein